VHHSSTSTYMPNFTEIKETFVDRSTTYRWTFKTHFIGSTWKSRLKNGKNWRCKFYYPFTLHTVNPLIWLP